MRCCVLCQNRTGIGACWTGDLGKAGGWCVEARDAQSALVWAFEIRRARVGARTTREWCRSTRQAVRACLTGMARGLTGGVLILTSRARFALIDRVRKSQSAGRARLTIVIVVRTCLVDSACACPNVASRALKVGARRGRTGITKVSVSRKEL